MGILRFDGSNDNLKWVTLAQSLKDVSDGAWTMAIGTKRAVDTGASTFYGLMYLLSGTGSGTVEAGVSINGSDQLVADGISAASTLTITGTTEHYFIVVTKEAGLAALTYSRYVKSTAAWSHNSPATLGDQIDATMLEIGSWQNADFHNGWINVAAWWEGAMTQANKEALVTNWRTSDLWSSAHGQPLFLTELNTTTPTDLAGNASGLTVNGTTLDGAQTFSSWNFDGTGAGAPQPVQRPRVVRQAVNRAATWCKRSTRGILVPDLWVPEPVGA